jgi:hypothetical protein
MEMKWEMLPTEIQDSIEKYLLANMKDFQKSILACFLKGSTVMGYLWKDDANLKELILKQILHYYGDRDKLLNENDERDLSTIVYYLGTSKLQWNNDLTKEVQESLYQAIGQCALYFTTQGIATVMHG